MEFIEKERGEIEKRKAELERQLAQRLLTQDQECQIKNLAQKIGIGLNNLDFTGKQELLRLLVEKVFYNGQSIEILTVIPLGEQLHPIYRGGLDAIDTIPQPPLQSPEYLRLVLIKPVLKHPRRLFRS